MFSRRKTEVYLPGWLWFFLILPLGLIVLLLYRQKNLQQLSERLRERLAALPQPFNPASRYTEPDSIPLEIRTGEVANTEVETEPETGADTEPPSADDLEIIEGIGPVISRILHDAGIVAFRQLADTPVERLREILADAGLRRLADPGTWPEQALLAAEANWDGLEQLQGTLKAGRRSKPVKK